MRDGRRGAWGEGRKGRAARSRAGAVRSGWCAPARTFRPTFPSGFTIGRSLCVEPATPMGRPRVARDDAPKGMRRSRARDEASRSRRSEKHVVSTSEPRAAKKIDECYSYIGYQFLGWTLPYGRPRVLLTGPPHASAVPSSPLLSRDVSRAKNGPTVSCALSDTDHPSTSPHPRHAHLTATLGGQKLAALASGTAPSGARTSRRRTR